MKRYRAPKRLPAAAGAKNSGYYHYARLSSAAPTILPIPDWITDEKAALAWGRSADPNGWPIAIYYLPIGDTIAILTKVVSL